MAPHRSATHAGRALVLRVGDPEDTVGWSLAIGTVIVAGIVAGRPSFVNWHDDAIRQNWATIVAIMSGLSGLIPWREVGRAFTRAHQILVDVITRYDADPTYTVEQVLNGSREAEKELQMGEYRAARPPANSKKPFSSRRTKRPAERPQTTNE